MDGFGWQIAPHERSGRTAHGMETPDGLWLFDPLDAPGLDEQLKAEGEVAGVAVCSDYHARDAGPIAARYELPVHVPAWCDRAATKIEDAPVKRVTSQLDGGALELRDVNPFGWDEAAVWNSDVETLYVPDILGTAAGSLAGNERLGLMLLERLAPPRDTLGTLEPERIRCGHGTGIRNDATAALTDALSNGRRRLPRAIIECGPTQLRAILGAVLE